MTYEEECREEMFGYFIGHTGPFRILSGIIWGQGKSAAEADCQRRLKEAGRWPAK